MARLVWLSLLDELADRAEGEAKSYTASAAELAMAALRACVPYILDMSLPCTDETYRYVTRRENEMTLAQVVPVYESVLKKTAL